MYTVFLDVDGVLNKQSDWKNKYALDKQCVHILGEICKFLKTNQIVLISTWRAGISRNGDTIQIQTLKDALNNEGLSIIGQTPISDKGRQAEVEYYIRRNYIKNYIILDDDESLFENPQKLNLFCPNYLTGLTEKDFKQIKKKIRG